MREVPSWNVQPPWSGAGSEEKLRIRSLIAIPQAQTFVFGFDLLNGLDLEVDAESPKECWAMGDRSSRTCPQIVFRQ